MVRESVLMKSVLNFSGIGLELGQMQRGLIASPLKAKEYFSILQNAGIAVIDRGTLSQNQFTSKAKFFNDSDLRKFQWSLFEEIYTKCSDLYNEEGILLNWGGDHSIAISTVGAFVRHFPDGHVLWIDAHADLNLPSYSLTGNLHGMPMSILLNLNNIAGHHFKWLMRSLNPEKLIYVGLRDLDPFEEETIERLGIKAYTRRRIRKWGAQNVFEEILHKVKNDPVHLSFDVDSVDPRIAPSTGVPVNDGLSEEDLRLMGEKFSHLNIKSIDAVELNPSIGTALQIDQTFITTMQFLKTLLTHPGGFDESMGQRLEADNSSQMEWSF